MLEKIGTAIPFLLSIGSIIISIRSFREKGFLLNNAYLYASEQEREKMDKSPYYRQSGIVFLLIGIIFLLSGIDALLTTVWIFWIVVPISVMTVIYAIISSILIEKQKE